MKLFANEYLESQRGVARSRSTVPFLLETKIPRKEPKSDFLLELEKRQAKEAERERVVVQIKGRAKK